MRGLYHTDPSRYVVRKSCVVQIPPGTSDLLIDGVIKTKDLFNICPERSRSPDGGLICPMNMYGYFEPVKCCKNLKLPKRGFHLRLYRSMAMQHRPEYQLSSQSPVLTARFHPFDTHVIIGGTYSGQASAT